MVIFIKEEGNISYTIYTPETILMESVFTDVAENLELLAGDLGEARYQQQQQRPNQLHLETEINKIRVFFVWMYINCYNFSS